MARKRYIDPVTFLSEDQIDLSITAALVLDRLSTIADREGRLEDRPRQIKAHIAPWFDFSMSAALQELHDAGRIFRYGDGPKTYIQIAEFGRTQTPHPKEPNSEIPEPNVKQIGDPVTKPSFAGMHEKLAGNSPGTIPVNSKVKVDSKVEVKVKDPADPPADKPPKKSRVDPEKYAFADAVMKASIPYVGNDHASKAALVKVKLDEYPDFWRAHGAWIATGDERKYHQLYAFAQAGNWQRYLKPALPAKVDPRTLVPLSPEWFAHQRATARVSL